MKSKKVDTGVRFLAKSFEKARKKTRKAREARHVKEYKSAKLGDRLATRMYALIGRIS